MVPTLYLFSYLGDVNVYNRVQKMLDQCFMIDLLFRRMFFEGCTEKGKKKADIYLFSEKPKYAILATTEFPTS